MPKKLLLILSGLIGVFLLFSAIFLMVILRSLQPVESSNMSNKSFVIPRGQAISIIGQRLAEEGLVRNPLAFRLYVKFNGLSNKIQAGSFSLSPSMSLSELSNELTKGTEDLWITILEGWRVEEVAEMLSRQEELTEFDQYEFLSLAKKSEGYLYPDTYLVPKTMSSQALFELFTDTFDKKVVQGLSQELANSEHSLEEILSMAALVEREARDYEQMRHVAGILWNRIEIGMALQVDATLQYITGYDAVNQSWWSVPTGEEKQIDSPFNTYLYPGLPPQPIANPSLKAIQATLNPLESEELYYLHDRQGRMWYAKTLEEHNANIAKYLR